MERRNEDRREEGRTRKEEGGRRKEMKEEVKREWRKRRKGRSKWEENK